MANELGSGGDFDNEIKLLLLGGKYIREWLGALVKTYSRAFDDFAVYSRSSSELIQGIVWGVSAIIIAVLLACVIFTVWNQWTLISIAKLLKTNSYIKDKEELDDS